MVTNATRQMTIIIGKK
jgi:hypothetical protein